MTDKDYRSFPALRWPLDVQHQEVNSQKILVLSCPLGIAEQPLGLHAATAPLLQNFTGKLSIDEIQRRFNPQGCTRELIEELIELLDKHLFLDSPRYSAAAERVRLEFLNLPQRPAFLAGLGYSAAPTALAAELEQLLVTSPALAIQPPQSSLLGVVSPHIDYRRGGACYGITWNQLRAHSHDLYLLMGTSHQYSELMFHLTRKDFASPLGVLPTDRTFMEQVAGRYGVVRSFTDELLHRREHSLELQIPFLRHLKNTPTIAPILVGSFYQMLTSGKAPHEFAMYEDFISSLAEACQERLETGSRLCVVAGVDMAHVGPHFGDIEALTPGYMQQVEVRDRAYLEAIKSQDKKALWQHIAEDSDARRICGFPTMYTILDLFERLQLQYTATLYDYRQAVDYSTGCAVTFAGMGLYSK